ncbi:SAM-dependent methyltransferase [Paucilactobacillus hokkaidonensis JCM 18461]|uniref:SAM-dependent methyltransferase n=2 Tax=Paucilactobacillus hokkaidonensis TaxID=1193095 RepID=A0A0A1GSU3_9LACO|nr:class I SAM-dependent methyltransferase [Paucilactobacillus hokkaidonensis]KRO10126.1 SAM-dependent methyltransferase [Paucilactobacillus hokkaidonensis]BAP85362.1 SAM-dependent methyltransferase [Paucilactobacillus hokkaidonensis JCM 18461]
MNLQSALEFSHTILKDNITAGETVIDATVGNGNDTIFLASLVGKTGRVYGFDIQQTAIDTTQQQLLLTGLQAQTTLICDGHENISKYVTNQIGGAIFNLGYLPGGDKTVITHGKTTIQAIKTLLPLLRRGATICIVIYYGHPGGNNERQSVEQFATKLDQKIFNVLEYQFINQVNTPPRLVVIQKR